MAQARKKTTKIGKLFQALFGKSKDLEASSSKWITVLGSFGTACLIIAGLTSLPYYIPTFYYYICGWVNTPWINEAVTTLAVAVAFFLIELSSNVTTPFAMEMTAALLKIGAAPTNANWQITRNAKKWAPGWAAMLSFIFGLFQLKATHILALGALIIGIGTNAASMFFSWNGNILSVAEMTEKERPKEHKGATILLLDSTKRAETEKIRMDYDKSIAKAEGADAKKLKSLKKEAAANSRKAIAASVASGCTWSTACYKQAVNQATADSVLLLLTFAPTAPLLRAEKDTVLSETNSAYSGAKQGAVSGYDTATERHAQIRSGVSLISQYLGVICSLLFLLSVLLSTMLKYIDIQGVSEAAQSLSTGFTTDFTTEATDDTQPGDSSPQTEAKLRKKIASNFSNAKLGTHKESTCAANILKAYEQLYELKYVFLKNNNHPNPDGAAKAFVQGISDTFEQGGHPADADFLEEVAKGVKTFDEYTD